MLVGLQFTHNKMKKGQLMSQPLIYLFYAIVAILILFFGIKVIFGVKDTGEKVEFESFVIDLEEKVNLVYHDSYGSSLSLDDLQVPNVVKEVCFVGEEDLSQVKDEDLKELISIDSENNVFFAGVDLEWIPRRNFDLLMVNGTVCDLTIDRRINLVLENVGNKVRVR